MTSRAWVVLVVLLMSTLAGCDIGMGPREKQPTRIGFESNGEQIYFTGMSASGGAISFSGGGMHVRMHGGSCASCHGVDRRGGARMMPRFWVVAPPITSDALFGEEHADVSGHVNHPAYSEASLRRAIIDGIDPSGESLDRAMPRWSIGEQDLHDLVEYLRGEVSHSHS